MRSHFYIVEIIHKINRRRHGRILKTPYTRINLSLIRDILVFCLVEKYSQLQFLL